MPKVDDELIAQVEELVTLGVPPLAAVLAQGVDEATFADWWQRGKDGGRGNGPQIKLRSAIVVAEARCEAVLVGRIRRAANNEWQAAAWLAERRFADRYVRRSVNAEDRVPTTPMAPDPFAEVDEVVVPFRRK